MGRSVVVAGVLALCVLVGAFFVYRSVMGPDAVTDPIAARVDAGPRIVEPPPPPLVDAGTAATQVEERAEIVAARGSVQRRVGDGPWVAASVGESLTTDDAVRAGRNAEATLRMGNGVEVRLSPRSEFTIRELSDRVSKIRLEEGHVTASVAEGGKRVLKVAARGTDAEAESAGGQFGVVTDGKGQLAVATTTGSVKLTAAGTSVAVDAGETSTAASGAAPSAPAPIPSSLFLKVTELGARKTNQTQLVVTGQTDPGSVVRAGDTVATVDDKGRFKVPVSLTDGKNTVAVDVTDSSGRTRRQVLAPITVDRQKPKIEAETTWGKQP